MPDSLNTPTNTSFASEITAIAVSRNPLAILFGLARLRALIEDFADDLLSSIEKSYYTESASKFSELIALYAKNDFYRITAASGSGGEEFGTHKKLLDTYFEESYYQDVDFYFFVLSEHPEIKILFERLLSMYQGKPQTRIDSHTSDLIDSNRFFEVLIPELAILAEYWKDRISPLKIGAKRLARDLYLSMAARGIGQDFWREEFIENTRLNADLIDGLSTSRILGCFTFLRDKLLKTQGYNLALSGKSIYQLLASEVGLLGKTSFEEKMKFVGRLSIAMWTESIKRENFLNVLRRWVTTAHASELVDVIFWGGFLSRPAFFEVKRKVMHEDFTAYNFPSLAPVGPLITAIDSSIVLRFCRPLFVYRLARVFNTKQTDLYYFIKFILTIHTPKTYNEYLQISRFFVGLEAFGMSSLKGIALQGVQFGWMIIAVLLLTMIAPFWVFLAAILYGGVRVITKMLAHFAPRVTLVSNFALGVYIALFAAVSFTFGVTFGLKDNVAIVYSNYRGIVNSATLVTSEVVRGLTEFSLMKASVVEGSSTSIPTLLRKIQEVNYLEGKGYKWD